MRDDKATPTRERGTKGPGGARMHRGGEDWSDVKASELPNRSEPGIAPAPAPRPGEQHEAADIRARRRIDTEDEVAEASDESFPASDPPSFNPGGA